MNTITQEFVHKENPGATLQLNSLSRFVKWTGSQEKNRMLWLAIAVAGHGCVITIITLFAILFTGNHFIYWPFAIAAMGATLIVNLAALPTKITIPVFFISILVDVVIIALCLTNGFNLAAINM